MESGIFYPYRTPKEFSPVQRRQDGLARELKQLGSVEIDDRASLIHLNSTYLDMFDRWYTIRGGMSTILGLICVILVTVAYCAFVPMAFRDLLRGNTSVIFFIGFFCIMTEMLGFLLVFIVKRSLGREFFSYTHFPIRFNRKTRMIHVFHHSGTNGVLTVPWDQAYFHIGRGTQAKSLLDLRGHLMDGDTVVDTFAVGNFFNTAEPIQEIWRFIVVYMEQGPQALPKNLFIGTSTSTGWMNTFIRANSFCNIFLRIPLIKWVFVALVTLMRWLVMKSCKAPVWPAEIMAESAIAPDDPYRWAEPAVTGAPMTDDKVYADIEARDKRRHERSEHR